MTKTVIFIAIAIAIPALLCSTSLAQNANNPLDVALLRWYQINTTARFNTCNTPQSLAFDGAHVWVACFNISNPGTSAPIQEFNKSDGTLIRTVSVPTNASTTLNVTLLFDGANIWAAVSDNPGKLYKIQASTGSIISTISVPAYPTVGTFDGTFVWTTNGNPVSVSKVNVSSGAVTTSTLFNCEGDIGPVFDGIHYWVSCQNSGPPIVQELDSTGTEVASVNVGVWPGNMVFDGTYLWVGNCVVGGCQIGSVSRINVTTLAMTPFSMGGCQTGSLAFDGVYLWVSGSSWTQPNCAGGTSINIVSKLQASSGQLVATYTLTAGALAFDGANVWATTTNAIAKF